MHKLLAALQETLQVLIRRVAMKCRHTERDVDDRAVSKANSPQVLELRSYQEFPVLVRPDQAVVHHINSESYWAGCSCKYRADMAKYR